MDGNAPKDPAVMMPEGRMTGAVAQVPLMGPVIVAPGVSPICPTLQGGPTSVQVALGQKIVIEIQVIKLDGGAVGLQ